MPNRPLPAQYYMVAMVMCPPHTVYSYYYNLYLIPHWGTLWDVIIIVMSSRVADLCTTWRQHTSMYGYNYL